MLKKFIRYNKKFIQFIIVMTVIFNIAVILNENNAFYAMMKEIGIFSYLTIPIMTTLVTCLLLLILFVCFCIICGETKEEHNKL